MCKAGDIIVVKNYKSNGKELSQHSFVVLSDEAGKIHGLDYDIICNVLSSFKDEKQHIKKMKYDNFPVAFDDYDPIQGNKGRGYIKADQFYYFNKDKLDYIAIGQMKPDIFELLIEFIQKINRIEHIIDNL